MAKFAKKEISLIDGVLVFAIAIAANLTVQFCYVIILAAGGRSSTGAGDYEQLAIMGLMQLAWLASTIVYFVLRKRNPKLLYPIEEAKPSAALGVILPVLCIAGFYLAASYFETFLLKIGYTPNKGVNTDTPGKFVLGAIVMVVLAPFCEELIFRGCLFGGLCKKLNPYVAALLSALAFTFMHMNPEQTVYQFFLGFACALAAYKSGSIVPSIVLHSGSNLIAMLLGIEKIDNAFAEFINAITATPALAAVSTVLSALVFGAAIYGICEAMKKLNAKRKQASEGEGCSEAKEDKTSAADEQAEHRAKTISFVIYGVTVGLCVLMWISVFVQSMKGA